MSKEVRMVSKRDDSGYTITYGKGKGKLEIRLIKRTPTRWQFVNPPDQIAGAHASYAAAKAAFEGYAREVYGEVGIETDTVRPGPPSFTRKKTILDTPRKSGPPQFQKAKTEKELSELFGTTVQEIAGRQVIVDNDDAYLLDAYSWTYSDSNGVQSRMKDGTYVYLHRIICSLFPDDPSEIDHIDGRKSNNRRANLRVVSRKVNSRNKPTTNQYGYRGVVKDPSGKYQARICSGGYDTIEEAATEFDRIALLAFESEAYLNFPDKVPGHIQNQGNTE